MPFTSGNGRGTSGAGSGNLPSSWACRVVHWNGSICPRHGLAVSGVCKCIAAHIFWKFQRPTGSAFQVTKDTPRPAAALPVPTPPAPWMLDSEKLVTVRWEQVEGLRGRGWGKHRHRLLAISLRPVSSPPPLDSLFQIHCFGGVKEINHRQQFCYGHLWIQLQVRSRGLNCIYQFSIPDFLPRLDT